MENTSFTYCVGGGVTKYEVISQSPGNDVQGNDCKHHQDE